MDRLEEALEEIKRFQLLTNWQCQDYLEIMNEIKEKWGEEEEKVPRPRMSAKLRLAKSGHKGMSEKDDAAVAVDAGLADHRDVHPAIHANGG